MSSAAMENIPDRVTSIVEDYSDIDATITADTRLVEHLGIDSLGLLALATSLESEFGIEIPDDTISEISTVGELIAFIEARLSARISAKVNAG